MSQRHVQVGKLFPSQRGQPDGLATRIREQPALAVGHISIGRARIGIRLQLRQQSVAILRQGLFLQVGGPIRLDFMHHEHTAAVCVHPVIHPCMHQDIGHIAPVG